MKYLSFDIEATGLRENDYIIEYGMVPFDGNKRIIEKDLAVNWYIKCPSFSSLESDLDPWVIEHNQSLIEKANNEGISLNLFKSKLEEYLTSSAVKDYFQNEKIVLFGKSLNAIDLPFLNRDLGWDFMRKHFHHQNLDLSSTVRSLIDMKILPSSCTSGSGLMKYLGMGEVAHTALEDAINTADMYLKILKSTEHSQNS